MGVVALAAGVAGCGNQRAELSDGSHVGAAGGSREYRSDNGDVRLRYPRSWLVENADKPGLVTISTDGAAATVYGYARRDLGTDPVSVEAQRRRIIRSLERRAPGFRRFGTSVTTIDGSPAVQVLGRGPIDGHTVRVRSVHVFKPGVEWVIDAYATPRNYPAANRIGFTPLLDSLRLSGELHQAGGKGAGDA